MSRTYRGNVWRLLLAQALFMFILWVPIWVIFLQRKGLSLTQIGLLEALAWTITAVLEVPTGAIADRWGRKISIAIGSSLYSLAMFLILADALSLAFLVGYALWNSSFAFVSGADAALRYDSLKADAREAEAAKQAGRSAAIQQGSQGVAALLGAALATVDITLCFTICGLAGLVATAIVLTIKEPPRLDDASVDPRGYWKNLGVAIGVAARRPIVRALLLVSAAFSVIPLIVYYFLLQPYALGVGLPIASLGIIVVAVQAATVLASWLAHRAGRFELATVVSAGAALIILATLVLGAVPSIPTIGLMLVVALAPALVTPLLSARLNDLIPSAQRATVLSMSALLSELGTAAAVPLLLWLADLVDPPAAIGISAALFAVVVIPLLIVWRVAEPAGTRSQGVVASG